jgi:hypothetical protein
MDIPVDSIETQSYQDGSDETVWDEAYSRVESYLRAHQIHRRLLLSRLVNKILTRAMEIYAEDQRKDPVVVAMNEADRTMAVWFDKILHQEDVRHKRISTRGRLALLMGDVPNRWPEHFLLEDQVPQQMTDAMRESYLKAGPDLKFSNMSPRPIDLGPIVNAAEETWETFQKRPLVKALVLWVGFLSLLGFVFYATR